MYFAIGWPQTLTSSENIHQIVASNDQSLFLLLSEDTISLWFCRPVVKIVQYQRTAKSLSQYGHNISAIWRSDSSQIVVQTSQDFLIFYQVVICEDNETILQLIESKNRNVRNETFNEQNKVPALILELQQTLHINEGISCIMSAEEEVVISTRLGTLCGVEWSGQLDENFRLNIIVPHNYHQKKEDQNSPYFIVDFKYSTIIAGFSLVLSNGLGAFLPLNNNTENYTQLQLISHVENALCTAINHKYAFIVFGLTSSEGIICGFDEIDRRYIISYRLTLPSNAYPEVDKILGPLTALQWTPDSTVLATVWENGGFALWSVFGSLLTCSLSWNYSLEIETKIPIGPFKVSSLAFGKEGFHLWMSTKNANQCLKRNEDDSKNTPQVFDCVCKISLVKSVLAANPCSSVSLESVLMASEDRLFVGGNKSSSLIVQSKLNGFETVENKDVMQLSNGKSKSENSNAFLSEQESNAVDSFQWIVIPMPTSYLDLNWPIRFFAIDNQTSQNIAIAGQNGFALYSLLSRRWKLFGNENHEKDFIVTGGFLWFYDFLIAGCYNIESDCFEIRAYSHRHKLDNSNSKIISIEKEVSLLSLHRNRLLALCTDGSIFLFDLHMFKKNHHTSFDSNFEINISAPIRVIINNLEIFPDCVSVCLLTDLHIDLYHSSLFQNEPASRSHSLQTSIASRSHSILINICGRVLLLEMDIDTTGLPLSSDDEDSDTSKHSEIVLPKVKSESLPNTIKFRKVVKLASNVENLWLLPHNEVQLSAFRSTQSYNNRVQLRPHLETSLYLSCGVHGMAIWLSLEHTVRPQYPKSAKTDYLTSENEHAYISKRIMLPLTEIATTIYPLAIRFREAIVLGAESDFTQPNLFNINQNDKDSSVCIPFCVVKRTSQVYLHYILRELLRRNLGYRAWEIANTCTLLPHFVHSLELLLHGVLEEEASSSQPIPDALLPRVVEFIRAFPVFLQTVIHCARKTELALWPHLFSIVGSPKDLFHQSLIEGQLETASSYIIVLQNLEKPEVATKCASRLLQAARIAGSWVIVKELKRFLRAANHGEESDDAYTGPNNNSHDITNNVVEEQQKRHFKELHSSPETSHNNLSNQTNSISPDSFLYMNGTEQTSAKRISVLSINNTNSNKNISNSLTSKIIPGAAQKETNNFVIEDCIEENILMKAESNLQGDTISLTNSEDMSLNKSEDVPHQNGTNGNGNRDLYYRNGFRNNRAYPGTILRMASDSNKFITDLSCSAVASSTSSISSFSSTISSESISPVINHTSNQLSISNMKENGISHTSNVPKMLKVVPISTDDANQCKIF